jgi:hypothetical protein
LGSRIIAGINYRKEYLDHFATTISLFYNGQTGERFSYIYRGQLSNDDTGSGSTEADLIYVPRDFATYAEALAAGEIRLLPITGSNAKSVDQQWLELNRYIKNDDYLNERRGDYAERNGSRLPFTHVLDVRLLQDFFINAGSKRHTLQVSLDIFNFTNLLNKDWGRIYFQSNNNFRLIDYVSLGPDNIPNFQFNNPSTNKNIDDSGLVSSRWQAQVGIRYSF